MYIDVGHYKCFHAVVCFTGIQFAVRMLEHTLKNLLVYRDSQPKLDCLQTPFTEKEKKVAVKL